MSKKIGRPTKFTPATRRKILRSVRHGLPLCHAAAAGGMSYQTLLNHRAKHADFADGLATAVAKGVESRLKVVEQAMDSPDEAVRLRAACWFLEHTQPQHFARNRVELTGADGEPLAGSVAIFLPQKDGVRSGKPIVPGNAVKEIENEH